MLIEYFADLLAPLVPTSAPPLTALYLVDLLVEAPLPPSEPLGPMLVVATTRAQTALVARAALMLAGPWRAFLARRVMPLQYYLDLAAVGFGRLGGDTWADPYRAVYPHLSFNSARYADILLRATTPQ